MAQRTCEQCGKEFQAGPTARFCSSSCRARRSEGAAPRTAAVVTAVAGVLDSGPVNGVKDATTRALTAVDRHETPMGMAAIRLAARIDLDTETGSAQASLVKALQGALESAMANASKAADTVDEVGARRAAKIAAARGA